MGEAKKIESDKIGALWKQTSKKGMEYLSGEVNGERVVAFAVQKKFRKNSPDYQVFKSLPTPTEKEQGNGKDEHKNEDREEDKKVTDESTVQPKNRPIPF